MCGGIHYWEVEGLVSVERWSCSRGASCVVEYTGEVERVVSVERRSSHSVCFALLQAYHCPLGVSMRWRFEHVPFGQLR